MANLSYLAISAGVAGRLVFRPVYPQVVTSTPEVAFVLYGGGGGAKKRKRKDESVREQLVELFAEAHESPELTSAVKAIVAPHVKARTETKIKIDWRSLSRDLDAIKRLLALAERAAQFDYEAREDEDIVELLLLN